MSFLRPILTRAPRAHLFRATTTCISSPHRTLTTTRSTSASSSNNQFRTGPAPPKLPKEEQELYEKLQAESTGAFSTPVSQRRATAPPKINQSPHSTEGGEGAAATKSFAAEGKGEELHPDMKRGVQPEFEGEKNPKTGEVGGPKNEPLRWGHGGDWSYNGRVTDF